MSCLWTGSALYCCLAMHAMPEWFAMHESWCSAYNNTNDPIAGVYLLYKEKTVQNHGIVLLKNSNTWQPTVKHWNMVLQMELQFLVLPVPPYSTKLKRQVLSIWAVRMEAHFTIYGIYRCDIPDKHKFIYSLYVGLYDDNSGKVLLLVLLSRLIISNKPFYTV